MIYFKDLEAWELDELQGCIDLSEDTYNKFVPLKKMWRDKPRHYWTDILSDKKGKMIPYMKDLN